MLCSSRVNCNDLVHPTKQISTQKNFFNPQKEFLILFVKKKFFKWKENSPRLKELITKQLDALNKSNLHPKNLLMLSWKINPWNEKIFLLRPLEKTDFLTKEKRFILSPENATLLRKIQIFKTKLVSSNY